MPRQTKLGLLVALVFLIGMGVVLCGQLRDTPSEGRADGLRPLVPPVAEVEADAVRIIRHDQVAAAPDAPAPPATRRSQDRRDWPEADVPAPPTWSDRPAPRPVEPAAGSMLADARRPARAGADHSPRIEAETAAASPAAPQVVSPVPGRFEAPVVPAGWSTYTVQAGDMLSTISTHVYGTSRLYQTIFQANRDKLPSADMIRQGMVLRIPPVAGARPQTVAETPSEPGRMEVAAPRLTDHARLEVVRIDPETRRVIRVDGGDRAAPAPIAQAPAPAESAAPRFRTYTVRGGDTLSSIAADMMGSSRKWRDLYEANKDRIANPDVVPVGLELRVPAERLAAAR